MTVAVASQTAVNFYQNEAEQSQSEYPLLRSLQAQGLAAFQRLGFPDRHDEDWRYTPVTEFLKQSFHCPRPDASPNAQVIISKQADVPWGNKLVYVDGVLMGLDALRKELPPGVMVLPILEALQTVPEKVTPYLDKILTSQHGFHAQNTAMLQLGLFIYVSANIRITEPILLVHWQTRAEQAIYLRHVVVMESGASLSLIEDYQGQADVSYYTNNITEIVAGPNACLKHYKVQRESIAAWHVGHLAVRLAMASRVESHIVSLGAGWSRFDARFALTEPKAECVLNGVYIPSGHQHMDHHTWVHHDAPNGTSHQDYKGIVKDAAHAVFNGQVHVARHAQKTVARQQNKNLLLSKQAAVDTKPQLDIAADDVQCTHGATVGQLDADALFYFATRGIAVKEATKYLIQAFAADNLSAIGHEEFSAWLQSRIVGANYE